MMPQRSAAIPHLVVLAPDAISGRRIELPKDYLVVGREPTCDVRLDDPHVSRTHAALQRRGSAVYVQDLGSSGGTFVNGSPVTMTELLPGDVVAFATVQARFDAVLSATDETRAMPTPIRPVPARPAKDAPFREEPVPGRMAQPEPAQVPLRPAGPVQARPVQSESVQEGAAQAGAARYDIGRQDAEVISNVGRDQYNAHVQQVVQQRDNFLRDGVRSSPGRDAGLCVPRTSAAAGRRGWRGWWYAPQVWRALDGWAASGRDKVPA
jgi:FHA domain